MDVHAKRDVHVWFSAINASADQIVDLPVTIPHEICK